MNNDTINISRAEYEELQRKANFFSKVSALLAYEEVETDDLTDDEKIELERRYSVALEEEDISWETVKKNLSLNLKLVNI